MQDIWLRCSSGFRLPAPETKGAPRERASLGGMPNRSDSIDRLSRYAAVVAYLSQCEICNYRSSQDSVVKSAARPFPALKARMRASGSVRSGEFRKIRNSKNEKRSTWI